MVNRTIITSNSGAYRFEDLSAGTYQITENQPNALVDGSESTPHAGATTNDDAFENIEHAYYILKQCLMKKETENYS